MPDRRSDSTLSRSTAVLLLVFVILVWGINWPVMKFGLHMMPPFTFSAIRVTLGALTMFLVLALRGGIKLPSRHDMPIVLSVGLGQIAAFLAFITLALQHVDAGRSAILSYTTPIWVVPAAIIFLRERLGRLTACGLALGLLGIAALFNPWEFDWSDRTGLIGNGYLLLAAIAWAFALLHVKIHQWHSSALALTPWQLSVAALPLAALALIFERDAWQPIDHATALVLAYNGPLSTAFAVWAWLSVNRALPAITSSLASLGVPVVGLIASVLTLGEHLEVASIAGLALISGGLVLVSLDTSATVKQTTAAATAKKA
jgi:drug/metabolite transporter (DMT)-like permease